MHISEAHISDLCLKSLQGAFKQLLKSMFHLIVEKNNNKKHVLISSLLKEHLGKCYYSYKIYEKHMVARGYRIV